MIEASFCLLILPHWVRYLVVIVARRKAWGSPSAVLVRSVKVGGRRLGAGRPSRRVEKEAGRGADLGSSILLQEVRRRPRADRSRCCHNTEVVAVAEVAVAMVEGDFARWLARC